jgi:ubiquinone/menaquinone biosynthesis C-methylase UbiE
MMTKFIDVHLDLGEGSNQIQPLLGDVSSLPIRDNSQSIVLGMFGVLSFTPHHEEAIEEIHRVMKPEGHFFATVYNKDALANIANENFGLEVGADNLTTFRNDEWELEYHDQKRRKIKRTIYCHPFSLGELSREFSQKGFEIIKINSILKLLPVIPRAMLRKLSQDNAIEIESICERIRGLDRAGSYLYIEAKKLD